MKKILMFFMLLLTNCSKETTPEECNWKYDGGGHIGDWIEFQNDSEYAIKNGCIYKKNIKVDLIVKVNSHSMIIKTINANQGFVLLIIITFVTKSIKNISN